LVFFLPALFDATARHPTHPEFTRPGIEALLENFDEMLNKDSRGLGVTYPFEWRP